MFSRSGRAGNYAYTVARVKAKKSLLLKEADYDKMMHMSIPEISRYISETGYSKEMVELANRVEGIDLVEYATYENMAKVFSGILGASQGELHDVLAAYLEKWDIWNLKVILRGKSYGLSGEKIKEDLVIAGSLKEEDLDKLLSLDNVEDILASYCKMEHIQIPNDVLASYKNTTNLGEIEDYLDRYHYIRLVKSINPNSGPTRMFQDYIRTDIDIRNLETILKLKVEGIYGEQVMKYVIPGGKQISGRLATQLANYETVAAALPELSQLEFYDSIKDLVESGTPTVRALLIATRRYQAENAKKFSHMYPLSVVPIIDYMLQKEIEVSNIRTISRGLQSGMTPEQIKGLLVI